MSLKDKMAIYAECGEEERESDYLLLSRALNNYALTHGKGVWWT